LGIYFIINKNNKAFNNIQEIKALFENISAPVIKNELLLFDMHNWNYDVFYKLPEWIQNKIKKSTQYQKKYAQLEVLDSKKLSKDVQTLLRPESFDEIVGQERAIKALISKIASPYPQHIILYGPPGVGKTTAARLALYVVDMVMKALILMI
jgi:ATP-dependent Clp protease ATP-binding subunit ClpA